ncbi:MAG: hypothetical protein C4519_24290 [Desulfobacteraceae bacterium]|nr:MAG: hypothetical protein C4519_24290 [Desulfobacteraceae bacterium]
MIVVAIIGLPSAFMFYFIWALTHNIAATCIVGFLIMCLYTGALFAANEKGKNKNAHFLFRSIYFLFSLHDEMAAAEPLNEEDHQKRMQRAQQDAELATLKERTLTLDRMGRMANLHGEQITNHLKAEINKLNAEIMQILSNSNITNTQAEILNKISLEAEAKNITPNEAHLLLKLLNPSADTGISIGQERMVEEQLNRIKAETYNLTQEGRQKRYQADLDGLTVKETRKRYK